MPSKVLKKTADQSQNGIIGTLSDEIKKLQAENVELSNLLKNCKCKPKEVKIYTDEELEKIEAKKAQRAKENEEKKMMVETLKQENADLKAMLKSKLLTE